MSETKIIWIETELGFLFVCLFSAQFLSSSFLYPVNADAPRVYVSARRSTIMLLPQSSVWAPKPFTDRELTASVDSCAAEINGVPLHWVAEFGGRGAGTEAVLGVRTETTVDPTVDPRRTEIPSSARSSQSLESHDHESQGVGPFFASGFNICFSDADFVALFRTAVETVQKKKYITELLRGTGRVPRSSLTMVIFVLTVADSPFGLYGSERAVEPLFMPPYPHFSHRYNMINLMVAVDHTADIKRHVYVYSRGALPLARSGRWHHLKTR